MLWQWIKTRAYGRVYSRFSQYTMLSRKRYISNLRLACNYRGVPGAIVECGTWRGGMIGGIASVLGDERSYYLFDSFEGLPDAQSIDGERALAWQRDGEFSGKYNNCRADQAEAEAAMRLSGAKSVHIVKGWFNETLPGYDGGDIALLRLDGDWYESTMQCLERLFCRVTPGGIVVLDDYYTWPGCARAVHEFLAKHRRPEGIRQYRSDVPYIVKLKDDGGAHE